MDKLNKLVNALGELTLDEILSIFDEFGDCDIEQLCDEGEKIINEQLINKPINDWSNMDRLVFTLTVCVGQVERGRRSELNKKLKEM